MDVCPVCGHKEITNVKHTSNVMNTYYNEKNPKNEIVLNSAEKKVTFKDGRVFLLKVDGAQAKPSIAEPAKQSATPVKPAVPAATIPKTPIQQSTAEVAATEPAVELKEVKQP